MKKYILILFGMADMHAGSAQTTDSTALNTDKNIRNKVLNDIQKSLDKKTKTIDLTLTRLDSKVDSLDIEIAASRDARDKVDKLVLRVQALEKKQQAIEENELNVYQVNYQSAIINLVSMDKEIKLLVLFNAFYELMDVQSLKLRFGDITFDIRGILSKYSELIAKYRKDPEIGLKVQELEVKLNALNDTFDRAFDPTEYINSATRMYLVN